MHNVTFLNGRTHTTKTIELKGMYFYPSDSRNALRDAIESTNFKDGVYTATLNASEYTKHFLLEIVDGNARELASRY